MSIFGIGKKSAEQAPITNTTAAEPAADPVPTPPLDLSQYPDAVTMAEKKVTFVEGESVVAGEVGTVAIGGQVSTPENVASTPEAGAAAPTAEAASQTPPQQEV